MASKSPFRTRHRELSKSPMRGGNFRNVSESPARSSRIDDVRKSTTRGDDAFANSHRTNKSPARSFPESRADEFGGFIKSPMRTLDVGSRRSPMRDSGLSLKANARDERVGAWVDQTGLKEEERGYGDGRVFGPRTSFNEWIHDDDNNVDQSEMNRSGQSPRRGRNGGLTEAPSNYYNPNVGRDDELDYGEVRERSLELPTHVQMHEDSYGLDRDRVYPRFQARNIGGYAGQRNFADQLGGQSDKFGPNHGNLRNVAEHRRILRYPDEGSSGYSLGSSYGYDDLKHPNYPISTGSSSARDPELERAELLRKYIELQEQFRRTGCLLEEPKERFNQRVLDDYVQDEILRLRREHMQSVAPNMTSRKPPCFTYGHDSTYVSTQDMEDSFYPPSQSLTYQTSLHYDPVIPNMSRRTRYNSQICRHPHHPSHDYMTPHPFMEPNQDTHDMYGKNFHHPSCSCSHCYVDNRQIHPQAPRNAFGARRHDPRMTSSTPQHRVSINHDLFVPAGYNRRVTDCALREPAPHKRVGSDCSSDTSSSAYRRPRRALEIDVNRKVYFPIAGGAPFILCHECFQLLKLPRKVNATEKKTQGRLKCGACSATMSLDLGENRSPVVSESLSSEGNPTNDRNPHNNLGQVLNEPGNKNWVEDGSTAGSSSINFESSDFDAGGYSFWSPSSANKRGLSSSSSRSSNGEQNHDSASVPRDLHRTVSVPPKVNLVRPPPGSPLRDHLDYSIVIAVNKSEAGNITDDQDEGRILDLETPCRNLAESVAAETEVHSHDLPCSGASQDSEDNPQDEIRVAGNEKSTSSPMKSSFRWRSCGNSTTFGLDDSKEKADVYINGHPIPSSLVKKAEKLAGTISPGNYWYDFKAGFWGVIGDQCLGIIPPFIQEFSYPLSDNCSGGNTGVYVNNRELHQNDLDLLATRGLPRTRDKFYVVDISGRVVDEDGGRFVVALGKLAPTVEKTRRGFGMHVPEALDD